MTFRKLVGKLHLALGLASGLVVFIVSLSGAVFVFQDDLRDLTQPWRHVAAPAPGQPLLLPSALQAAAVAAHPGATASWTTYQGPGRPVAVYLTDAAGGTWYSFVQPYTGRVLHEQDLSTDFFTLVQRLHMYLLLPPAVGKWVVDVAVLTFVLLLASGLVLWWPRNRAARRQRFRLKWAGASAKRRLYDLHAVLGFYASALALLLALTGLCISYEWLMQSVSALANAGQTFPAETTAPRVDSLLAARPARPLLDEVYAQVRQHSPTAEMVLLGPVGKPNEPVAATAYRRALHFAHRDDYLFHPRTGQLLQALPEATKSHGRRLADLNYDLHTGQLFGFGGKVVACLASLVAASLPVTGLLVWRGRRRPATRRQPAAVAA